MTEVVLRNGQLYSVDGREVKGKCNRCGICCSVYESGFPCRHLMYEKHDGRLLPECNYRTLHAGYEGRPFGCVAYPKPDDVLPFCGYRYD